MVDEGPFSIADGTGEYPGWSSMVNESQPDRRFRNKRRARDDGKSPVNINSLMDIVTIILVYLLGSFQSSPLDVQDPTLEIPTSTTDERIEDATVVMLTGPVAKRSDPTDPAKSRLEQNTPQIIVDGTLVVDLDAAAYRVPNAAKQNGYVIKSLKQRLIKARQLQELRAEVSQTEEFEGRVIILADKQTPYRVLTDVLVTAGQAGFGDFRFAVIKGDK